MVDLWIMRPNKFLQLSLEEGFRQFIWNMPFVEQKKNELFSIMRAETAAYGPLKLMFMDFSGAAEYSTFDNYGTPRAVYPTWAGDEDIDTLIWLIENPVGADLKMCTDEDIAKEVRPVFGQNHTVVIHRLPPSGEPRQLLIAQLDRIQKNYPEVTLMLTGCSRFSDNFGRSFKAAAYKVATYTVTGLAVAEVHLPSGKSLQKNTWFDPRYADWFEMIGIDQADFTDHLEMTRASLRSARWASRNFKHAKPFVIRHNARWGENYVEMQREFNVISDKDFILPAARRRLMRNIGIKANEYDMFTCDTCIMHNACTLYREGSVCTVKGSDAVALADMFGSRNAETIMDGLTALLKRNAERLEDAFAQEEASEAGLDPEVTKLGKTVFDQGVKLAKLRDPSLSGTKVQVNVGVAGSANVSVGTSNSKELMAAVVGQLEASGIPRDEIDSSMIKGVLRNMAQSTQGQAVSTAAAKYELQKAKAPKTIEGGTV